MIAIFDNRNNRLLDIEIGNGCKRTFTLMKEDSVTLKFSLARPLTLPVGSYCNVPDFGRFELTELYQPKHNAKTGGWDYEAKFNAHYWKWKNKMFMYDPESGSNETSWSHTAALDVQMGIFLRNLQNLGYTFNGTPYSFDIDSSVKNEAKAMTYDSQFLLDALFSIAETWECEVWVTESVIHFGRCEFGDPVDFEEGVNVDTMTPENTKQTYATRVYAFGSTRNLPTNYRPTAETIVVNGVVQKRLMLPEGTPRIDAYRYTQDGRRVNRGEPEYDAVTTIDMPQEEAVEAVLTFDNVYPRTTSTMSSVTTKEYDVEGEDGKPTGDKWKAYRYKDTSMTFKQEYILPNIDLEIQFQTGSLAGMTFAVKFNPDAHTETEAAAQVFEIIRNENYGRPLPDETLKPKNGDEFVLVGWDATKIESLGLVAAAEAELLEEADKAIVNLKRDPNSYRCKMISERLFDTNGVYTLYSLGDRINLINEGYFAEGHRVSRIMGYEYDLAQPFNSPTYVVGEVAAYSRLQNLENKVDTITLAGQTYTGGSGGGVYIIRTNDSTPLTDTNVLSALRARRDFLSRLNDDTANGVIRFIRGLLLGNGTYGIDNLGKALLKEIVAEVMQSPDFQLGMSGWAIYKNGDATKMEIDELLVRRLATFFKLEIRELAYVAGNIVLSNAGSEIAEVEEIRDDNDELVGWKCSWVNDDGKTSTTNTWLAGDQAQCSTDNIGARATTDNPLAGGNHYYWRLVTEVGDNYVILSATDHDSVTDNSNERCCPQVGDKLVQMGYRLGYNANSETNPDDATNRDRTSLLMLSTNGEDAPSIKAYASVTSYELPESKRVFLISPKGVVFNSEFFSWSYGGIDYPQRIYMGDWHTGDHADYFTEWTHRNCSWLCVNPNGTAAEPDIDSPDWQLVAGDPRTLIRRMRFQSEYGEYDTFVDFGDTVHFYAIIEDGLRTEYTSEYTGWQITRDTGDPAKDGVWNTTRAAITDTGEFELTWSDTIDDLQAERATYTITAQLRSNPAVQVKGKISI